DVDLTNRLIRIGETQAKNNYRRRTIPLTEQAADAMRLILNRWQKLGGCRDEEYILPHRDMNGSERKADFTRPIGSIKKAFQLFTAKAEIKGRFRIYDCRVTAITRYLGSSGASLHIAKLLFGHFGIEMQRRYFKPDLDLLRDAVEVIAGNSLPPKKEPAKECA